MRLWPCLQDTRVAFTPSPVEICWLPPPTKAKIFRPTEAELVWPCVTLMTRKRSSFCESKVRTAHTLTTAGNSIPRGLILGNVTIQQHIKDGNGFFIQRFPKTVTKKWGSGEEGERGMKTVMILKKYKISKAIVTVCHCTDADKQF